MEQPKIEIKESGLIEKTQSFSWSMMYSYATCPRDFKVKYLEGLRSPSNMFGLLGCALHELFKEIYEKNKFGSAYAYSIWEKTLRKEYKTEWKQPQYGHITTKEVEGMKFYGFLLIKKFFALAYKEGILRSAEFNEKTFKGNYKKHRLKAIVDCGMMTKYGFTLLDWKTGAEKEVDIWQLLLYAALVQVKYGKKVDAIGIVYVKLGIIRYHEITPELGKQASDYISNLYHKILTDTEFAPKEHKYCDTCYTRKMKGCPLFKDKK